MRKKPHRFSDQKQSTRVSSQIPLLRGTVDALISIESDGEDELREHVPEEIPHFGEVERRVTRPPENLDYC